MTVSSGGGAVTAAACDSMAAAMTVTVSRHGNGQAGEQAVAALWQAVAGRLVTV